MKINIISDDNVNIEGLTKRQMTLIEETLRVYWYETSDYQYNFDERQPILDEFKRAGIKKLIDLEAEREEARKQVDEIMKGYKGE